MNEWGMAAANFYESHRSGVWATAAVGVVVCGQVLLALWTARRVREIGHLRERLSRLADGLALLTDTTESGLSTIIRELQQANRRQATAPRAGSRSTVTKRVTAAARRGEDIPAIARDEALSESEVRLHMKLAGRV